MKKMERILHAAGFRWGIACLAAIAAGIGIVYYWRVFYEFSEIPPLPLTLIAVCAGTGGCGRRIFGATLQELCIQSGPCGAAVWDLFLLCQSTDAGPG